MYDDTCTHVSLQFRALDLLCNHFSDDGSLKSFIQQEPSHRSLSLKSSDELIDWLPLITDYQKQPSLSVQVW